MNIGDRIPEILGKDQNGNEIKASDYKGRKIVLYSYPKANTSGCTAEACSLQAHKAELEAAGKLILQAAARELKNGKIVDLGPIGTVYPSVNGKWVEKAEDLQKSDLTLKTVYRPSDEIDAAVKGAKLAWASAEDEKKEQENGGENTTTDPDEGGNGGGNTDTGDDLEG